MPQSHPSIPNTVMPSLNHALAWPTGHGWCIGVEQELGIDIAAG